jgi:hypothetical protein
MSAATLRLTLTGRGFCLTPLSEHIDTTCTGDPRCEHRATHRLLSRRTASIELLCDTHAESWARAHAPGAVDLAHDGTAA